MHEIYQRLGAALAQRRRAAGLNQTEVAARIGKSRAAVATMESGGQTVTADMLLRLAAALECNAVDLLPELGDGGQPVPRSSAAIAADHGEDVEAWVTEVIREGRQ